MKLKFTLATLVAFALAGAASAASFDAKVAPTPSAQAAKLQVDAKTTGYVTDGRYTAQAPANNEQFLTAQPNYGAGKFKAKWIDVDQAKKIVFTAGVVFKPDNVLQQMAVMDKKSVDTNSRSQNFYTGVNEQAVVDAKAGNDILIIVQAFRQSQQGNILAGAASAGVNEYSVANTRLGASGKTVDKVAKAVLQLHDGTTIAGATDNTRGYDPKAAGTANNA